MVSAWAGDRDQFNGFHWPLEPLPTYTYGPTFPVYGTSGQGCDCPHCGNWHSGQCPRIKAIELHPDGTVKRVEYFP